MADLLKGAGLITAHILHETPSDNKYIHIGEPEVTAWMVGVVGEHFPEGSFHEALKDGVYLCKLINIIQPGSVKKVNTSQLTAFKEMENIQHFLTGCENFGVDKTDLFQTEDLYQGQNIPQVISTLLALQKKKDIKYTPERESEVRAWIESILCFPLPGSFHEALKDGVYLCRVLNRIQPGSVKTINESKMAFKQMENIQHFLAGCENLGVDKTDLFQTVDLYQGQNIPQVVSTLLALQRKTAGLW